MYRSGEGCCVLGLKSTPQAVVFGLACAAVGALAATLSWGSLEMNVAVSPRLADDAHPVSARQVAARGMHSNAGLVGEVVFASDCQHAHHCDDCAFCQARARKAQQAAATFVPLHMRPEYIIEPPDALTVNVHPASAGDEPNVQPVRGEHAVDPDGFITIGTWGKLHVAGQTVAQIKRAVEELVDAERTGDSVDVAVCAANSRAYYVITDFSTSGLEEVARHRMQGSETALDAITSAGPLNEMGKKRIWIARPTAGGVDTIIPVRWQWSNASTVVMTNPGLLPGDRVFLSTPPSWAAFVERATKLARARQANSLPDGIPSDTQTQ